MKVETRNFQTMSQVMAFMLGRDDFDEDRTSFLSDDDFDDDEDEDSNDDFDEYEFEQMFKIRDEAPSYTILYRLKEANDALQREPIPPDYENRHRKVTFHENPVYIDCFNISSDDEDEDEKNDDDGNSENSLEISFELLVGSSDNFITSKIVKESVADEQLNGRKGKLFADCDDIVSCEIEIGTVAKSGGTSQPPEVSKVSACTDLKILCNGKQKVTVDEIEERENNRTAINGIAQPIKVKKETLSLQVKNKVPNDKIRVTSRSTVPLRIKLFEVSNTVPKEQNPVKASNDIHIQKKKTVTSAPIQAKKTNETSKIQSIRKQLPINNTKQPIQPFNLKIVKQNGRTSRPSTTKESLVKSSPSAKEPTTIISQPKMSKCKAGGVLSNVNSTEQKPPGKKVCPRPSSQISQEKEKNRIALEQKRKSEQIDKSLPNNKKVQHLNLAELSDSLMNGKQEKNKTELLKCHRGPPFEEWLLKKRKQKEKEDEKRKVGAKKDIESIKQKVEADLCKVRITERNKQNIK
ncbi:hypothetical protein CHUAL_007268 [Chamberlinius hualienensis]